MGEIRFKSYDFSGINALQAATREWSNRNFGNQAPEKPLLGITEEVGELYHHHLKKSQGIRTNEDHEEGIADALGDIIIFMADYAGRMGIKLSEAIAMAANEALNRDWSSEANKEDN